MAALLVAVPVEALMPEAAVSAAETLIVPLLTALPEPAAQIPVDPAPETLIVAPLLLMTLPLPASFIPAALLPTTLMVPGKSFSSYLGWSSSPRTGSPSSSKTGT